MPHKQQKIAHGINSDLNIAVLTSMYSNGKSENDTNSEFDTSAVNSSFQSEVSDDDAEMDNGDEGVTIRDLNEFSKFKILSKDKAVVVLDDDNGFFLKGKVQIKVLKGKLLVLGHYIKPSSKFTSVYSPRGYSLLDLQGFKTSHSDDISETLINEGLGFDESKLFNGDCIFIMKKLAEAWTTFLHKNLNVKNKLNILYRDHHIPEEWNNDEDIVNVEKTLDINILHPDNQNSRLFRKGENWDLALTSIDLTKKNNMVPRLLVAGGKGVGKSTFLRWLTNSLLSSSSVVFLDLDPGQAELSIPGYMSVGIISEPLLGPNFCQVNRTLEQSIFLGEINVANCPGRFIKVMKTLIDFVVHDDRFQGLPVVVNTMGWCKGVGLMLSIDIIRYFQPSTVVQLHSRFHRKNYPYSLDPSTVDSSRDCWESSASSNQRLSYNLLEFLAVPESLSAKDMRSKDYWGLPDPRLTREIVLLSFLGKIDWPAPVYKIPLSSLTLGVLHTNVDPGSILAIINLALVDLCTVNDQSTAKPSDISMYCVLNPSAQVMPSLGIGLVRNIDMSSKVLYLATNATLSVLDKVNCLLAGSTRLPECIMMADKRKGLSYLAANSSNPLDNCWQRSYKPRNM